MEYHPEPSAPNTRAPSPPTPSAQTEVRERHERNDEHDIYIYTRLCVCALASICVCVCVCARVRVRVRVRAHVRVRVRGRVFSRLPVTRQVLLDSLLKQAESMTEAWTLVDSFRCAPLPLGQMCVCVFLLILKFKIIGGGCFSLGRVVGESDHYWRPPPPLLMGSTLRCISHASTLF